MHVFTGGMPYRRARHRSFRAPVAALLPIVLILVGLPCVGTRSVFAAAPDVREITPAGISIDGSRSDWDSPSADFLADMYEAGNSAKLVLSKLYARYDCATETMFVLVVTTTGWKILPSNADNYVKIGQTDKRVDGNDGPGPTPPAFAYIGNDAWEAAFQLDPGRYAGDAAGLNVHAQVVPETRASTSAVAGRRLDVVIDCAAAPTATLAPTATPAPTPSATAAPTTTATPAPTTAPTATGTVAPTATATPEPSATATATSAPTPTGTLAPGGDPPLIAVKVNDQGTSSIEDDRITGGATFELRADDGDGRYEPDGDDAPVIDVAAAPRGFAIFLPPAPGDYWITESSPPAGLDIAPPQLVTYTTDVEACGVIGAHRRCVPDDDGVGGFTVVAVLDSPTGGSLPAGATAPPTDTALRIARQDGDSGPLLIASSLITLSVGLLYAARRRMARVAADREEDHGRHPV